LNQIKERVENKAEENSKENYAEYFNFSGEKISQEQINKKIEFLIQIVTNFFNKIYIKFE